MLSYNQVVIKVWIEGEGRVNSLGCQQEIIALEYSYSFIHYPSNTYLLTGLFEFEDEKKNIFLNKVRGESLKEFSNIFFI